MEWDSSTAHLIGRSPSLLGSALVTWALCRAAPCGPGSEHEPIGASAISTRLLLVVAHHDDDQQRFLGPRHLCARRRLRHLVAEFRISSLRYAGLDLRSVFRIYFRRLFRGRIGDAVGARLEEPPNTDQFQAIYVASGSRQGCARCPGNRRRLERSSLTVHRSTGSAWL